MKKINTVQLLILFNLLLAFIAFVKDMILAAYFGTSHIADAVNLAFFIPDTIGNNLIGSAIAVASIPVLTKLAMGENKALYHAAIQKLLAGMTIASLFVAVFAIVFAEPLLKLFHLTRGGTAPMVREFFYMLSPVIVAAPVWLLGSSILQASKRFILPAVTPIIYNLLLLFSLLVCLWQAIPQTQGGTIYSIVITAATILAGIITWYHLGKKQKVSWGVHSQSLKLGPLYSTFTSYLLILLFGQAALLTERMSASNLETGTIAALSYAYRIAQFPIWVFIAAINTFILPTISAHVINKDGSALKRDVYQSFLYVIGISAVLSVLLVAFSEPLIKLVLARGSFDSQSVKLTSTILKGYGLSIVGQSLYVFCTRYFVAEGKMKVPLIVGLTGSLLNIILLKWFVPLEGAAGIGHAAAISSTLNGAIILSFFIKNLLAVRTKEEMVYE